MPRAGFRVRGQRICAVNVKLTIDLGVGAGLLISARSNDRGAGRGRDVARLAAKKDRPSEGRAFLRAQAFLRALFFHFVPMPGDATRLASRHGACARTARSGVAVCCAPSGKLKPELKDAYTAASRKFGRCSGGAFACRGRPIRTGWNGRPHPSDSNNKPLRSKKSPLSSCSTVENRSGFFESVCASALVACSALSAVAASGAFAGHQFSRRSCFPFTDFLLVAGRAGRGGSDVELLLVAPAIACGFLLRGKRSNSALGTAGHAAALDLGCDVGAARCQF
jgi:hypothetical protein